MSFPYQDGRRRQFGAGAGFSSSGRRTVVGYWVPLALTVGIATAGVAAWIWSERSDEEEDSNEASGSGQYGDEARGDDEKHDDNRFSTARGPAGEEEGGEGVSDMDDDPGMVARMHNTLRRTPSPQQILDGASKRVAAGMAAAGTFFGGLTSIQEENGGGFEDHSRWSEEMQSRASEREQEIGVVPTMSGAIPSRAAGGAAGGDRRKKTVAIVLSSESAQFDPEDSSFEHPSLLSHLPDHIDPDNVRVFVLIYAPGLKHAIKQGSSSNRTLSVASSYSNIAPEEAMSSGELPPADSAQSSDDNSGRTPFFNSLYSQAQAIVEKESTIMPFSTQTGFVHLVRHLSPDIVYVQESLAGNDGEHVQHISGWVRQVVVVVGDEGGRAGLIDSDDESALAEKGEKWWQREGTTGIGKRIDVVDSLRTGDDWRRRVSGHD